MTFAGRMLEAKRLKIEARNRGVAGGDFRGAVAPRDNAPWRIPGDLRPAEQPEALSVDAKLTAATAALMIVRDRAGLDRDPSTGKRWPQRDRLEFLRTICDNALRRIR